MRWPVPTRPLQFAVETAGVVAIFAGLFEMIPTWLGLGMGVVVVVVSQLAFRRR